MGFIWGQKVMGRVRKGRKSSNLLFRYPRSEPSHVEFCSELFFIEIPQLSIITELCVPTTFFCICSFLTANNSKDFKKRKRSEGCDSLLPVGNLCFSFCLPNHTPSIIFEGKTSKCEVSKIFGCCEFFAFNFYLIRSHPHMESLKGNQFSSVIHSFVGQFFQSWLAAGFHMPKICDFFRCFKKALWILALLHRPSTE